MAKAIGKVLKEARLARGLSQRDLERLTGMSPSQISQIENGVRADPAFSTISKLATALGVSLDVVAGQKAAFSPLIVGSRFIAELERARLDALDLAGRIEKLIGTGKPRSK